MIQIVWHKLLVHFKYLIKTNKIGIDHYRLVVSVDAGRPYLFVRKQNFLKNIPNQKNPQIFVCNNINGLSFTAFKNFKLELMKTFQFIQISLFRNESKSI